MAAYLGSDLVSALAGLDVHDLPHGCVERFDWCREKEKQLRHGSCEAPEANGAPFAPTPIYRLVPPPLFGGCARTLPPAPSPATVRRNLFSDYVTERCDSNVH